MKLEKSWYMSALGSALIASAIALPAAAVPTVIDTQAPYFSRNVREQASTFTNSVNWVNLYTTNITVPYTSVLRARFTAESLCERINTPGICRVRVVYGLPGGALIEMEPASGLDYAFDSTDNGSETTNSMEGHALERSSKYLEAGAYNVAVQISVNNAAAINFTLDDWHLVLELLAS